MPFFFTFHPSPTQIATFQCVLMTDGTSSFVKFLYADGEMQWTKECNGPKKMPQGAPMDLGEPLHKLDSMLVMGRGSI